MIDKEKRIICYNHEVIFTIGNNPVRGKVVGFTPKKVKIERTSDKYVNVALPDRIIIINPTPNMDILDIQEAN